MTDRQYQAWRVKENRRLAIGMYFNPHLLPGVCVRALILGAMREAVTRLSKEKPRGRRWACRALRVQWNGPLASGFMP